MIPEILSGLVASISTTAAIGVLKKILVHRLASKKVKVEATDKETLAVEILEKADEIRAGESPEEASKATKEAVEEQVTILDRERNRLIPIARREHWAAFIFAIIAGIVFFSAIILAITGTLQQAIVTLIASAIPGFLSKVFYSRESNIEKQIKEISSDIRESEKVQERLKLLEETLTLVPVESRSKLIEEFTKRIFKK